MAVYVDNIRTIVPNGPQARRAGRRWCHMWADTPEELHAMAAAIGMKPEWFQDHSHLLHYDLVPSRRARAVALGAKEVGMRELAAAMKKNNQPRGAQTRR